ncbi:MAG TPA: energy transducer TonB [Gemmatimonadales bacterium]
MNPGSLTRSRRWAGLALAGALALIPGPVVAQVGESAFVAQARTQVRLGNLDSADALLGRVIGAPLASDTALRAEALILLAVVRYYQGNDSATTAAFREALSLSPTLQVSGLAQMDPAIFALFEVERLRIASRVEKRDTIYSCTPRCVGLDVAPRRVVRGGIEVVETLSPPGGNASGRGAALLRATLDTLGFVEPGSVEVVRSNLSRELTDAAVERFREARYSPAIVRGRPVRVRIEYRINLRIE